MHVRARGGLDTEPLWVILQKRLKPTAFLGREVLPLAVESQDALPAVTDPHFDG